MKFRNHFSAALAAVFALQAGLSAFAAVPPYPVFGTELLYGEPYAEMPELYRGTHSSVAGGGDGYADMGAQYAVVPWTDVIFFEKGASTIDPEQQTGYLCWVVIPQEPDNTRNPDDYAGYTILPDGRPAVTYSATQYTLEAAHAELLEYGKPYPVCPDSLPLQAGEDALIWLLIQVLEQDASWSLLYQLDSDWEAPYSILAFSGNEDSGCVWRSDRQGWWVQCADGSYLTDSWYQDPADGTWYYLDEEGYMLSSAWLQSPSTGLWYYFGADGRLLTDAMTPDGYYVNIDGVWVR